MYIYILGFFLFLLHCGGKKIQLFCQVLNIIIFSELTNKLVMSSGNFREHICIQEEKLTKPYDFKEFYHIVAYPARLSYELDLN